MSHSNDHNQGVIGPGANAEEDLAKLIGNSSKGERLRGRLDEVLTRAAHMKAIYPILAALAIATGSYMYIDHQIHKPGPVPIHYMSDEQRCAEAVPPQIKQEDPARAIKLVQDCIANGFMDQVLRGDPTTTTTVTLAAPQN